MSWIARLLRPKVKTDRRHMTGESVAMLLFHALQGQKAPNYRHLGTKRVMAVTTREMVRAASDRSYRPWERDAWECEQQALELLQELQKHASAEGCSHAAGILMGLHADDPTPDLRQDFHVWVWALCESAPAPRIQLFDATAREWADIPDVHEIHFSMA